MINRRIGEARDRTRTVRAAVRYAGAWLRVRRISTRTWDVDPELRTTWLTTIRLGRGLTDDHDRAADLARAVAAWMPRHGHDVGAVLIAPAPAGGHEGRILLLSGNGDGRQWPPEWKIINEGGADG